VVRLRPRHRLEQDVEALLVLLAPDRENDPGVVGDPERLPGRCTPLRAPAAEHCRVPTSRNDIDPAAVEVEPFGGHVPDPLGHRVEAHDQP
jgi:hypothetical protein